MNSLELLLFGLGVAQCITRVSQCVNNDASFISSEISVALKYLSQATKLDWILWRVKGMKGFVWELRQLTPRKISDVHSRTV